jgi:hypothetical protein
MQARPGDRVRAREDNSNTKVVGILSTDEVDSVWGTYTRYIVTADDGGYYFVEEATIRPANAPEEPDEEPLSNEEMLERLDTFLQPLLDKGWELFDGSHDDYSVACGPSVARDLYRGNKVVEIEYLPDFDALDLWGEMAKHCEGDGWEDALDLGPEEAEHVHRVGTLSAEELIAQYSRIGLLP